MMKWRTLGIFVALIATGALAAWVLLLTKPETKRTPPPVSSPLVQVTPASVGEAELTIRALGTIKAAQQTVVRAQVTGQVEALGANFEAGGLVDKGDLLVQIDPADYQYALELQQSALDRARADYDLEMGQQRVARTEIDQLNKTMPGSVKNSSLALRVPQLAQARADLQSAETQVEKAQLDRERTTIVAPYNALVVSRDVSLGSQATTAEALATLVGTDEYRIEAAIALDKLHDLGLKRFDGAKAQVFSGSGKVRNGKVLHAIGTLDETTRMGRVLITVPDPLGLQNAEPALFLGDQAEVLLSAGTLQDVAVLPRSALRGENQVWVALPNGNGGYTLDIRQVSPIWRDTEYAFIGGDELQEGELIITSVLGAPVDGMPIRLAGQRQQRQKEQAGQKEPQNTQKQDEGQTL